MVSSQRQHGGRIFEFELFCEGEQGEEGIPGTAFCHKEPDKRAKESKAREKALGRNEMEVDDGAEDDSENDSENDREQWGMVGRLEELQVHV